MKARIVRMERSQGIHLSKALLKKAKLDDDIYLLGGARPDFDFQHREAPNSAGPRLLVACEHETKIVFSIHQVQRGSMRKPSR